MIKRTICCLVACAFAGVVWAEDFASQRDNNWHQWRGPEANGVAPHGNPPIHWDANTNIKWKVPIRGEGKSTPIVWQDRIYLLSAIKTDRQIEPAKTETSATTAPPGQVQLVSHTELPGEPSARALAQADQPPAAATPPSDGERQRGEGQRGEGRGGRRGGMGFGRAAAPTNFYQFVVICLDRKTGQTIWQKTATEIVPHEGHHQTASYASASPITDGKNLYVWFGSPGLFCYDLDGNLKWQRDLGDFDTRNSFGEGASPALYGDTLVINCDHEGQSFITALDANTGKPKWRVDRDEQTTWDTPLVVEHNGKAQIIVNATNRSRGYDLETGEELWECGGQASGPIASPVANDMLTYCMTGQRGFALYAIPLDSQGDITDTDKIAWHRNSGTPYVPSPLLYGNRLWFTKSRNAIVSCVDATTGEPLIDQKRLQGMDSLYASPVGAAGRIYIASREGTTAVLRDADELEVLATNQLDDTFDASPAVVGDELYLRGQNTLYCIAEP